MVEALGLGDNLPPPPPSDVVEQAAQDAQITNQSEQETNQSAQESNQGEQQSNQEPHAGWLTAEEQAALQPTADATVAPVSE